MKKKLFLHVGPGKTGTSAIQSFLAYNKDILMSLGYVYPEVDSIEAANRHMVTGGNVASLAKIFLRDSHPFAINDEKYRNKIIEKLEKILVDSSGNNIILSSELLSMLERDEVSNLKVFFDRFDYEVFCIFYLRRHDQIAESDYAQQVKKHRYIKPIDDDYCLRVINNYNFSRIISNYEDNFGENSTIVRVYETKQFVNGSLLEDFLEAIDMLGYRDLFLFKNVTINPSPSRGILEIMRITNDMHGHQVMRDKLLTLVFSHDEFQKGRKDNYISFEMKSNILNKCNSSYTELSRKYLNREMLFFDKIEPYEVDILSNEEIVSVFLKLLQYEDVR